MKRTTEKNKNLTKFVSKKSKKQGFGNKNKKSTLNVEPNGYLLYIFFTVLATITLSYNLPTSNIPVYQEGDICRRDIKAPGELTVIDEDQTEIRRKQAIQNVLPIFDFDTESLNKQIISIHTVFKKWRDQLHKEESTKQNPTEQPNTLSLQKTAGSTVSEEITGEIDISRTKKSKQTKKIGDDTLTTSATITHTGSTNMSPDKGMKQDTVSATPLPDILSQLQEFQNDLGFPVSEGVFKYLLKNNMNKDLENIISHVFSYVYSMGIVSSHEEFLKEVPLGFIRRNLVTSKETTIVSTDLILDIDSVSDFIKTPNAQLPIKSEKHRDVILEFLLNSLKPNLTLNKLETQIRIKSTRNSVKNVMLQVKPGEIIVREGDRVEETHILFLKELGNLRKDENKLLKFLGAFILLLVMGGLYIKYIQYFRPVIYAERNKLYIIGSIALLLLLANRLFMVLAGILAGHFDYAPFNSVSPYLSATPFASGPLMIALLIDPPSALIYSIYQSVSTGIMTGGDFSSIIVVLVGGVAVVLGVMRHRRRTDIIRAGLIVCLANMIVVFGLSLVQKELFNMHSSFEIFCGFAGGVFVVLIVSAVMPALESLFRITTDIRLTELSSFDHPLIKRMILNAPGTHQHSILVGSLSEAAAEAIGVNALLARVASYFHDIGKIRKPYYFVENIGNKVKNQHNKLSPNLSGLVIISHVKEGVEMAKKAKLGKRIIDIIQEHHGTKVIHYFFNKALEQEQNSNTEPSPDKFRYPGPKPSSRESAIVLLADQVEAASRTLNSPTHAKIKLLVKKIINDNLIDEQFESCNLTLKDISKISDSFIRILTAMFHHRIDYPGIRFEEDEKLRNVRPLKNHVNNRTKKIDENIGSS